MADPFIRYAFLLPGGEREEFTVRVTEAAAATPSPEEAPPWTRLEFHQCPNCPWDPGEHPVCPLAAVIAPVVRRFDGLLSHDAVRVEVETPERVSTQPTTVQRAIGSLLGLYIATSGCPHTTFFRPMARFHLPLASREETLFRATGAFLLGEYLRSSSGGGGAPGLEGLQHLYQSMQIVNAALVRRLQAATETDSSVNAIIILDLYARTLDLFFRESLEKIRPYFAEYLAAPAP